MPGGMEQEIHKVFLLLLEIRRPVQEHLTPDIILFVQSIHDLCRILCVVPGDQVVFILKVSVNVAEEYAQLLTIS